MAISEGTASLTNIFASIRRLNGTADEASDSVASAERALQRVQQVVDNAQVILDDDGRRLLAEAMEKLRETGQQSEQLTELAHEARQEVEQYVAWMLFS